MNNAYLYICLGATECFGRNKGRKCIDKVFLYRCLGQITLYQLKQTPYISQNILLNTTENFGRISVVAEYRLCRYGRNTVLAKMRKILFRTYTNICTLIGRDGHDLSVGHYTLGIQNESKLGTYSTAMCVVNTISLLAPFIFLVLPNF